MHRARIAVSTKMTLVDFFDLFEDVDLLDESPFALAMVAFARFATASSFFASSPASSMFKSMVVSENSTAFPSASDRETLTASICTTGVVTGNHHLYA